jgi:hypothetical protein
MSAAPYTPRCSTGTPPIQSFDKLRTGAGLSEALWAFPRELFFDSDVMRALRLLQSRLTKQKHEEAKNEVTTQAIRFFTTKTTKKSQSAQRLLAFCSSL